MTKNIALLISELLEREIVDNGGELEQSDTIYQGKNAFLYEFENKAIKGKIVVSVTEHKPEKV